MQDELLWAAAWLHLATAAGKGGGGAGNNSTADAYYLSYIYSNGHTLGAEQDDFTFSWDDKRVGTKVLLATGFLQAAAAGRRRQGGAGGGGRAAALQGARRQLRVLAGAGRRRVPVVPVHAGGHLFKDGDSNMQYVTS